MGITFRPTEDHPRIAEAYALDAVDAAAPFGVTLDFSEASVRDVESILAKMHEEMSSARPSEEDMWAFAKIYGSYIGEVMRRAHGGTWGVATLGDEEAVALDLPVTPSRPSGWKVCVGIVPVVGRQPTEASGKNAPRSKARRTKAFEDMTPESATHVPPRTAQLHATSR